MVDSRTEIVNLRPDQTGMVESSSVSIGVLNTEHEECLQTLNAADKTCNVPH